jgi:hypothetical protein
MALLTNGPTGGAVWEEVSEHVVAELGLPSHKARLPKPPVPAPPVDLTKYVGRYERKAVHSTVSLEGDHLVLTMEYIDISYDLKPPPPMPITPVDGQTFVVIGADGEPAMTVDFLDEDADGKPQLLFAARLARRVTP